MAELSDFEQAKALLSKGVKPVLIDQPQVSVRPASSSLLDQLQQEAVLQFGLKVSSRKRSPSQNAAAGGAQHSYHLSGNALDVSGPPEKMRAFAEHAQKNYGPELAELFYDPLGGFKGGKPIGAIGGHGDHVHVAYTGAAAQSDFEQAKAFLARGVKPEPVSGPAVANAPVSPPQPRQGVRKPVLAQTPTALQKPVAGPPVPTPGSRYRTGVYLSPFTGEAVRPRKGFAEKAGRVAQQFLAGGTEIDEATNAYYQRAEADPKLAPPLAPRTSEEQVQAKAVKAASEQAYKQAVGDYRTRIERLGQTIGKEHQKAQDEFLRTSSPQAKARLDKLTNQWQQAAGEAEQLTSHRLATIPVPKGQTYSASAAPAFAAANQERFRQLHRREVATLIAAGSLIGGEVAGAELAAPVIRGVAKAVGKVGETAAAQAVVRGAEGLAAKANPVVRKVINQPVINPLVRGGVKVAQALKPDEHAVQNAIAGAIQQPATYVASTDPKDIRADKVLQEALTGAAAGWFLTGGFKLTGEGLRYVRDGISRGLKAPDLLRQAIENSTYAVKETPKVASRVRGDLPTGPKGPVEPSVRGAAPADVRPQLPKPVTPTAPVPKRLPVSPPDEGGRLRPKPTEPTRVPEVVAPVPEATSKPVFDPEAPRSEALAEIQRQRATRAAATEATAVPEPKIEVVPKSKEPTFAERLAELQNRTAELDAEATSKLDAGKEAVAKAEARTWAPEGEERFKFRDFDTQPRLQIGDSKPLTPEETNDLLSLGRSVTENRHWNDPEAFAETYGEIGDERMERVYRHLDTEEGRAAVDSYFNRLDELEEIAAKQDVQAALKSTGQTAQQLLEKARAQGDRTPEGHKRLPMLDEADPESVGAAGDTRFTRADLDTLYNRLNTKGRSSKEYTLAGSKYSLKALIYDAHTLPNDAAVAKPRAMKGVTKTILPEPELPLETPATKARVTDRARAVADKWATDAKAQLSQSAPMARRKKGSRTGGTIHPDDLEAIGKLVAAHVLRGAANLADALEAAGRDLGDDLKPHAEAIYAAAKKYWDSAKDQHGKGEWPAEKPVTAPQETPAPERPVATAKPAGEASAAKERVSVRRKAMTRPEAHAHEDARPQTTGPSNQKQTREVENGVLLREPEKGKGVGRETAAERAKGESANKTIPEYLRMAEEIGRGERSFKQGDVALLTQGKRALLQDLNKVRAELDNAIKAGSDAPFIAGRQSAYAEAQQRLQKFVDDVQKGKTEWSNIGRELQIGIDVDHGNFQEVLLEASRKAGREITEESKEGKALKALSGKIEELQVKLKELESLPFEEVRKEASRKATRKPGAVRTREQIAQSKKAHVSRLKELFAEVPAELQIRAGSGLGGVEPSERLLREVAPEIHAELGLLAKDVWEEGVIGLKDLVTKVREVIKDLPGITDSDIIHAWNDAAEPGKTPDEVARGKALATRQRNRFIELEEKVANGDATPAEVKERGEILDSHKELQDADAMSRRAAEIEKRIEKAKAGPFVGPPEPKPEELPHIKALIDELADVRKQQAEAIKAAEAERLAPIKAEEAEARRLESAAKALQNRIADAERRLEKVKAGPETGPRKPASERPAEVQAIQDEIDALRKDQQKAIAEQEQQRLEPVRAGERLQRQIAETQRKIAQAEAGPMVGPKEGRAAVDPELQKLRDHLTELRKQQAKEVREAESERLRPEREAKALDRKQQELRDKIEVARAESVQERATRREQQRAEWQARKAERDLELQELDAELGRIRDEQKLADQEAKLDAEIAAEQEKLAKGDYSRYPQQKQRQSEIVRSKQAQLRQLRSERYLRGQIEQLKHTEVSGPSSMLPKDAKVKSEERLNLEAHKALLEREVKAKLSDLRQKTFGEKLLDALHVPKSLRASFDLSAPGRQGIWLAYSNPDHAAAAFGKQLIAWKDPIRAERMQMEILSRPNAPLYKRSGLYLSTVGNVTSGEEQFGTRLFPQWKKLNPFDASERAYVTYLNSIRADAFDRMMRSADDPHNIETAKQIAQYINSATGRGGTGSMALEKMANGLAPVLWSPRYAISRADLLLGRSLWAGKGMTPARKAILKQYVRSAAGLGTLLTLAYLGGANVRANPQEGDTLSSDFAKPQGGKTRIDVTGGTTQPIVATHRFLSGQKKTQEGKIESQDRGATLIKQFRYKLAPTWGLIWNTVEGKDAVGNPFGPLSKDKTDRSGKIIKPKHSLIEGIWDIVRDTAVPLSLAEMIEAGREDGLKPEDLWTLVNIVGLGVQQYD